MAPSFFFQKGRKMLHYHIVCKCSWSVYPEIVTGLEEIAFKDFIHLSQLIYDLSQMMVNGEAFYAPQQMVRPIVTWTPRKMVLTDGTTVSIHQCLKDCIEHLDGLGTSPFCDNDEEWERYFRDIIYEL